MQRLKKMIGLWGHAYYKKFMFKLKDLELAIIADFIKENEDLSRDDFVYKVNRMFLDNPNKPKNYALIQELLTVVA